jgi:trehalose utilization protein
MNKNNSIPRRTALALIALVAVGTLATPGFAAESKKRVVVWSEGTAQLDKVYTNDVNSAMAEGLKPLEARGWEVIVANLSDPDQGLSDERLNSADVLIWWGHKKHGEVKDALVEKIAKRVRDDGMGFLAIHSAHFAKPYQKLMSLVDVKQEFKIAGMTGKTPQELKAMRTICSWREYKADGTSVKVIVKDPTHPIAKGVKDFNLPKIERYGEPYAVPTPEAVVLDGVYTKPNGDTEPGRMGLCWSVGKGKVFYFTPGHETYQDFWMPEVKQILNNAVQWAAPAK